MQSVYRDRVSKLGCSLVRKLQCGRASEGVREMEMMMRKSSRGYGMLFGAMVVSLALGAAEARAAFQAPITGEIEKITILDRNDHWSRGTITVGGINVIIPRNMLIDLPANRLTLKQIYDEAPAACQITGETGLSRSDVCNCRKGAMITILANRSNAGDVIAGEIMLEKDVAQVTGIVTFIDHTNGYLRVNGIPGSSLTGTMIRINDPLGRHTIQQGPGCDGGPNCSADPRYGLDPDNYTITFATGYPACVPSTVTGGNRTTGANSAGLGDPFCPHTNRPTNGPVPNSFRFAPIQLGDHLAAEGNYELVGGVHFFSAHTMVIHSALTTASGQPDYLIFAEVEWDAPGFQNDRIRGLFIGFSSLGDSQLDIFALHVDPATQVNHEFPIASTVGNPDTTNQGVPPNGFGIFKIRYDVDFSAGVRADQSPCVHLANAGFTPTTGGCPGGATLDVAQNFSVLSPISREMIGRSRNKLVNAIGDSQDIRGNASPNGEYLTPVGIGHPEFVEVDLARIQTPLIFAGEPWNLDRRLGPGGCEGPCEATPQPLDPFPYSGLDPRTQAAVPVAARNRILSFFPFGAANVLAWPPLDPPSQGIVPVAPPSNSCQAPPPPVGIAPVANNDLATTAFGSAVTINLVSNDTDTDGTVNPASVTIVAFPTNGTVTLNSSGSALYTPNSTFAGTDSFSYTVKDNQGLLSNVAQVSISVSPPATNVAPIAVNDSGTTVQGTAITLNVLSNDSDPDGTLNPSSLAIVTPPASGTAISNLNGTITYTPATGFTGNVTFTYRVSDNVGAQSNIATVTVTVTPSAQIEVLAVTRAEFRIFRSEWRVDGTSNITTPGNVITIFRGPTVGGSVIGTATVDATGGWSFRERNSSQPQSGTISIQSSGGKTLLNIPVTLRN